MTSHHVILYKCIVVKAVIYVIMMADFANKSFYSKIYVCVVKKPSVLAVIQRILKGECTFYVVKFDTMKT